ncbi:MAG TPA: slipin family protein [Planctomycetota bacterium]|nr:slipin family protein [Planctomycetota bacterium]
MLFRIHIKQSELGLLFRRGDFVRVLGPGTWFLPGIWFGRDRLEIVDTLATRFRHSLLDLLVRQPELRERLEVVDLSEDERALVWRDGRLFDFVSAGLFAYWRQPHKLRVETYSAAEVRFQHAQLDAVLGLAAARASLATVDVEPHERLLVRRGGELVLTLGPGRHAFWNRAAVITWKAVDLREQLADVQGQEIMTADKVTLRLNLVVAWRITDPVAATTVVDSAATAVYREAQLSLRAAVGGRDLERLLADKDAVAGEVRAALSRRAAEFGVAIASVGVRDIVLPGEMKTILNQVIEAQKQAEANLIRRREETAAARSQANTARLLAENPVLLRMKELEALEAILRGTRATFVLGQGDLGQQVRSLIASNGEQ